MAYLVHGNSAKFFLATTFCEMGESWVCTKLAIIQLGMCESYFYV